jgi:hypothetical protein
MNEAFVYIWRDSSASKFYLGYHKGSVDDNYAHSSTVMESFTMNSVPSGFTRRILATGTNEEMIALEQTLLVNRKERRWEKYHNISLAMYPYLWDDPEYRAMMGRGLKARSGDPEFRQKQSEYALALCADPEFRQKRSDLAKKLWADPEYRANQVDQTKAKWKDPEYQTMQSEKMKAQWKDPAFRQKQIDLRKSQWADPEFIRKQQATCSVCGHESRKSAITRWHNERCKQLTAVGSP